MNTPTVAWHIKHMALSPTLQQKCIPTHCLLTLWRPTAFGDFRKRKSKRMWLCTGIPPFLFGLRTWLKRQKTPVF